MAGNPDYTSQAISGYNSSPPADDGTQVAGNLVKWTQPKEKLGDPLKTLAEAINTEVSTTFGEVFQMFKLTSAKTSAHTVLTSEDGTLFLVTGDTTVTLLAAATAGAGFRIGIKKTDTAGTTVTIDPNSTETIDDSATSITLTVRYETIVIVSDGSEWWITDSFSLNQLGIPNHDSIVIDANGIAINTEQVAFNAHPSGTLTDVTGDGTAYTVVFATERFDQNSDFDGTSTLTAPVTARYWLGGLIFYSGASSSETTWDLRIVTSNQTYVPSGTDNLGQSDALGQTSGGLLVDMDAADTATIIFDVGGGTKIVDLDAASWFSGWIGT